MYKVQSFILLLFTDMYYYYTSNSSDMCKSSCVCVVTLQGVVNECILSSELKFNKYPMLRE